MLIDKIDDVIHIVWEFPIQTKTSHKNGNSYTEYRVTVPKELIIFTDLGHISCDDKQVQVRGNRVTLPVSFMRQHDYSSVKYDLDTSSSEVSITFH